MADATDSKGKEPAAPLQLVEPVEATTQGEKSGDAPETLTTTENILPADHWTVRDELPAGNGASE